MHIELWKKPTGCTIIEGFPGFGLVGTIVTEFLLEHLKCEQIGEFIYDELPAMIAIHKGQMVRPMAVFHCKKYNLIILQTILNTKGFEWKIAEAVVHMAKVLKAKKIISVEGVAATNKVSGQVQPNENPKLLYYGDDKLKKFGAEPVVESIIIGVSAAVMLKYNKLVCIFAETQSNLPDSKAASQVIGVLDKYLSLEVDTAPLLKQAEDFENKLKNIIQQSSKTAEESDKKYLSYLG